LTDKSLQSPSGVYKWKFVNSENGNEGDNRHIQDEDISRKKKKLSHSLMDTKAKKGLGYIDMFLFSDKVICLNSGVLK
jgi:hypothetical protein